MRGFPLLNALVVLAFFAIAWWPLRALTERSTFGADATELAGNDSGRAEAFTIRILSSHPLETLTVEHLGRPLLAIDSPGGHPEVERLIKGVEFPHEGLEFWVDAKFATLTEARHRCAIAIEIVPGDIDREPRLVTLWSEPGKVELAEIAVFLWDDAVH